MKISKNFTFSTQLFLEITKNNNYDFYCYFYLLIKKSKKICLAEVYRINKTYTRQRFF